MFSQNPNCLMIQSLVRGFPDKLIYSIFSLAIATKYVTIPGFCYFVCNFCHNLDPFTGICASIIGNSVFILRNDTKHKNKVRIIMKIQGVELEDTLISPEFFESIIFIKFVKVLLKLHIRFSKIKVEYSDPFKLVFSDCLKMAYLKLNRTYFVRCCCNGLYFNTYCHLDLISPISDLVKSATISIHSKADSAVLLNLLNLELLRVSYERGTKDADTKELKKWIRLVSGMKVKRTIIIKLGHMCRISDFLIELIRETVSQNKLITIKIILDGATPIRLKRLRSVQDHIDTVNIITATPEYFGSPSTYDILNSSTSLSKIIDFTAAKFKRWDIECLNNSNINDVQLFYFGSYTSTPVEKFKNLEKLKTLNFCTNSGDLSKFKLLKDLQMNFNVQSDMKSFQLPPNLRSILLHVYGLADPKIGFQINNRDQLKQLRTVSFEIKSGIAESIGRLVHSLPASITTLSFILPQEYINSRLQTRLNFGHLINLENLRISSCYFSQGPFKLQSTLEIGSLPQSIKSLNFVVHPCIKPILPFSLPDSLQQISVSVYHDPLSSFFMRYNFNQLSQLSSLNIETWMIDYFDLRALLPESILYFRLSLKYDMKKATLKEPAVSTKKAVVELPFDSHSILKYLEIKLDDKNFEVKFQGEMSEYDYYKLKVIRPLAAPSAINKVSKVHGKLRLFK